MCFLLYSDFQYDSIMSYQSQPFELNLTMDLLMKAFSTSFRVGVLFVGYVKLDFFRVMLFEKLCDEKILRST